METIVEIIVKKDFNIIVKFEDGFISEVNMKEFIRGGISNRLLDYEYFKKVKIDEFGGLCWENGFDICPNFLRGYIENMQFVD